MNTHFKVFASYNILQNLYDIIHVLIFATVSKCQKSPKLTNIVNLMQVSCAFAVRLVPKSYTVFNFVCGTDHIQYDCKTNNCIMPFNVYVEFHIEKMRRRGRLSAAYHIERSIAIRQGLPEYLCACQNCRGARVRKVETVARHHRLHGRDPYLQYPVLV